MSDPILSQGQSDPSQRSNETRADAKSPDPSGSRKEESKQTQGGQQQQQQRLDEGKIDGTGREKRESRNSEVAEPSRATSNAKDAAPAKVESKAAPEKTVATVETKGGDGSKVSNAPFTQTTPGDKLLSGPSAVETKGQSQRYRDRFAEVMRDFHAGSLRGQSNQVVKDADEAKALASEQASKFDSSAEQKDSQAH